MPLRDEEGGAAMTVIQLRPGLDAQTQLGRDDVRVRWVDDLEERMMLVPSPGQPLLLLDRGLTPAEIRRLPHLLRQELPRLKGGRR